MLQDHDDLTSLKLTLEEFAAAALETTAERIRTKAHKTWLALGGDSLTAVFFMGACHQAGIEVGLPDILQAASIGDLIEQIAQSQQVENTASNGIEISDGTTRSLSVDDLPDYLDLPLDRVQGIGPCSPMQENFVARQNIDPTAYQLQFTVKITSTSPTVDLTIPTVTQAWKTVVKRHPALRTHIFESVSRPGRLDQVVVEEIDPEIIILSHVEAGQQNPFVQYSSKFPHCLILAQIPNNALLLRLIVSHAIVDAISIDIITRDLFRALTGTLPAGQQLRTEEFLDAQQPETSPDALSYWSRYLEPVQRSFLSTASSKETPTGLYTIDQDIPISPALIQRLSDESNATLVNACQVAYALVLHAYTGTRNVSFSYTTSGRQKRIRGLQEAVGNFVNTLPCRVDFEESETILEALEHAQADYRESIPYQGVILNGNQDLQGPSLHQLGDSLLTFQRGMPEVELAKLGIALEVVSWEAPSDYNYTLAISIKKQQLGLRLTTWASLSSKEDTLNILQLFRDNLDLVLRHPSGRCSNFLALSTRDQEKILSANRHPYPLTQSTVHEQVWATIQQQPDNPAVCAWDGQLTYSELGSYANRLAASLIRDGIKIEEKVGLCMAKSRWVPVAMMAILQAGGVVVPLGNEHPRSRIDALARNAEIQVMLADPTTRRFEGVVPRMVVIDTAYMDQLTPVTNEPFPKVSPDNAGWIIQTSGSTGTPKAVVLEHKTLCSTMHVQAARYKMGPWVRAIQFSAHTFDVCVKDIFTTLTFGGCVCIPSEAQRLDNLELAMKTIDVNFASLTPTVARMLDLRNLPRLDTIVCTGEALSPAVLQPWLDHGQVKIFNGYGPSECSHVSTINGPIKTPDEATNIGFPAANRLWVADLSDFNRLCPIGAVGELLIEGAIAREYLHNPEITASAFVSDPGFIKQLGLLPGRRMYRTGDLVRQNRDGSLTYLGRRDTQVKIRGQRVEIGEIESRISQSLPGNPLVCVDLIQQLNSLLDSSNLIAAIDFHEVLPDAGSAQGLLCEPSDTVRSVLQGLHANLIDQLPLYMVPAHFVPFVSLPTNASGKLDRRATKELLKALTETELAIFKKKKTVDGSIMTNTEQALQAIWAEVLQRPATEISADDHFVHLGGDSVIAMRMTALARRNNISLSVTDIIQNPRLSDMARVVDESQGAAERAAIEDPAVFELWGDYLSADPLEQERQLASVAELCQIDTSRVEDVYPTTPLQEGLMAMTMQSRETYVAQHAYRLDLQVSLERFKAAWAQVATTLPILRTRVVYTPELGSLQVVARTAPQWVTASDLTAFLAEDRAASFSYGVPLHRFAIINDTTGGVPERYFVWTAHHSAYDGPTVMKVFDILAQSIQEGDSRASAAVTPSPRLIRYLEQTTKGEGRLQCEAYWTKELEDAKTTTFPNHPSSFYLPSATGALRHSFTLPREDGITSHRVSAAILLRAAWALVVASHTSDHEAMLAVVLSGRDVPLIGIEDVVAPTITTVPCRVQIDRTQRVADFLTRTDTQSKEMAPYAQFGLANIRRAVPSLTHDFNPGHLFLVQPGSEDLASTKDIGLEKLDGDRGNFEGYLLVVECTLDQSGSGVLVEMRFDAQVLSPSQVQALLSQLEHVAKQLQVHNIPDRTLKPTERGIAIDSLDLISPQDKKKLLTWNRPPPQAVQASLVVLVQARMVATPDALAVCAWDGTLTYSQLWEASSRLARHLTCLGVGPETFVGLSLSKSQFAVISVLAILLARGAVVPLEIKDTDTRYKTIADDAEISVVLVDAAQATRFNALVSHPVIVNSELLESLPSSAVTQLDHPSPASAAWVIYTSGSTGVPKGVVLEHQALCTAVLTQASRFGVTSSTRTLQFSAFTFDLSIEEMFTTLVSGGCLCVLSESDRTDRLTSAMNELAVTFAILTPTVLSLLRPESVPASLDTLVLAGEAVKPALVKPWLGRIKIFNGYGPAECSMFSTINGPVLHEKDAPVIGSPVSNCLWVTSPLNHNSLVPVGAEGELLIEGPLLAREYLHDPEKTMQSFVTDPTFIHSLQLSPGRRMYRTGDLVRQNPDNGLLEYLGRLDTQIKIHGQRVEIGEIESHIVRLQPEIQMACVDLVQLGDSSERTLLAAVEFLPDASSSILEQDSDAVTPPSEELKGVLSKLRIQLQQVLPLYMVPTYFIPMTLSMNASGKLDRKATRSALTALKPEQLRAIAAEDHKPAQDQVLTEKEQELRQLWIQVLGLSSSEHIGKNSDFFQLGGDSVAAMKLVAAADKGTNTLKIGVTQIMQYPLLADMARVSKRHTPAAGDAEPASSGLQNGHTDAINGGQSSPDQTIDANSDTILPDNSPAIYTKQGSTDVDRHVSHTAPETGIPPLNKPVNGELLQPVQPSINAPNGNSTEMEVDEPTINWSTELIVPSTLPTAKTTRPSPPRTIILTGSTGFLGGAILKQLIASPSIQTIHCIAIRSMPQHPTGPLAHPKVHLHAGNLSLPNLGLEPQTAETILSTTDAIIQNGADVSFVKSYFSLRQVNVESTKQLAAWGVQYGIPIHYISTASVAYLTGRESYPSSSVRAFPPSIDGEEGYITTKWAAEVYLENMQAAFGLSVVIHRPSCLIGEGSPVTDMMSSVFHYSKILRAVPRGERITGYFDFISIEKATGEIVDAVLGAGGVVEGGIRFLFQSGEIQIESSRIEERMRELTGEMFVTLEMDEWVSRAEGLGMPELVGHLLKGNASKGLLMTRLDRE
ncbi:hypothetical protein BJY04DRAFT_220857 [Aspergillus karnatakaensis]|uniref:uncharacterized protein n=1 Tax=Aspergillus karnatakaensis TaxID=1810916 RepID=UPI003CCD4F00